MIYETHTVIAKTSLPLTLSLSLFIFRVRDPCRGSLVMQSVGAVKMQCSERASERTNERTKLKQEMSVVISIGGWNNQK